MDAILHVLCENPVIVHGNKYVEAECLVLSQTKRKERKVLCISRDEWKGIKQELKIT